MSLFKGKTLMITGGTGSFGNAVLNRFLKTDIGEYSCAVTPQVRQTGNRLSGLAGTAYASLLA